MELPAASNAGVTAANVQGELDRILASPVFVRSRRMCALLEYLVHNTLAGRAAEIKEYTIGAELYGRGRIFDPRVDPIVRIDAGRLRAKLREYYDGAGIHDPIRIQLEPGSYVPAFVRHHDLAPEPRTSLAVLPFVNLGDDPEDEHFADGLTEQLIASLSGVPSFRVIARTSSFAFKGSRQDIRGIAAQLDVAQVLEGSVRRIGGRWRITASLIQALDGYVLWTQQFDGEVKDVFRFQDQMCAAIAAKLGAAEWTGRPSRVVLPGAWAAYLKGRHYLNQWTPAAVQTAIACFDEALALDPDYAPGYTGLSDCHGYLGVYGFCPPRQAMPRARFAARKAISIDHRAAEPHVSLARVLVCFDWNWPASEKEYLTAIDLSPGCAEAHRCYANLWLVPNLRFDEATAEINRALELDPLSSVAQTDLAVCLNYAGRVRQGLRIIQGVLDSDPGFQRARFILARTLERLECLPQAVATYESVIEDSRCLPFLVGWAGYCFGLAGQPDKARAALARLDEVAAHSYVSGYSFALVHAGMKEDDSALEWLERAVEDRCSWLIWLGLDSRLERLRKRARFRRILRLLRLESSPLGLLP